MMVVLFTILNTDSVRVKVPGEYTISSVPYIIYIYTISYIGMEFRALYSQLSKINHSCEPNVKLDNIENSAKQCVIATRKIQIDEEIGLDYTSKGKTRSERPS